MHQDIKIKIAFLVQEDNGKAFLYDSYNDLYRTDATGKTAIVFRTVDQKTGETPQGFAPWYPNLMTAYTHVYA